MYNSDMNTILPRPRYLQQIHQALRRSPVTAILGPRQCGKTTLARLIAQQEQATYFDLESLQDQRRLQNPYLVLQSLNGLVILDEIQAMPELFVVLRVMADRPNRQAKYLILGSASPALIRSASESLAGRIEFIELNGFDLTEVGAENWKTLWLRGGFPRSFLAESEEDSLVWRENFIRTFLERDLPQLGISIPPSALRRFWTMLAHYHAQTWNASELARSLGFSDKTVRGYLDLLTGAFVVRQLQPWYENIGKRQVKAPKIYLRDTGLLHSLLEIPNEHALLGHPKVGASWEGFALEQTLQVLHPLQPYFWRVHGGAEIDLLFIKKGRRYGVEFKFSEAPRLTPSIKTAQQVLSLERVWIIYPGQHAQQIDEKIFLLPLPLLETLRDL